MNVARFSPDQGSALLETITERLRQVGPRNCAVVLDFDGVISSKAEDWIFLLPEAPGEAARLSELSALWQLNLAGYDAPYQRHLLYQAAAMELGLDIEPGPGCPIAKEAAALGAKVYVLTARTGLHAGARMQEFLAQQGVEPIETYQVGRVTKDRQLSLLLEKLPDHRVLFVEDSADQLREIEVALRGNERSNRLEVFLIDYGTAGVNSEETRGLAWSVLDRGARARLEARMINASSTESLKIALEHGRNLFIYHAGQRFSSLRYYFVAMAGLVVALGSLDKAPPSFGQIGMPIVISGVAIVITVFFGLLDKRNQYLVDCDRVLMGDAEKQLEEQLRSFTTLYDRGTARVSEAYDGKVPGHPYHAKISPLTRYRRIVPPIFMIFFVLWAAVLVWLWMHPGTPGPIVKDLVSELRPVYFDFDKFAIRPDDAANLDHNAKWLNANPNLIVTIESVTDQRGSVLYNQKLSGRRAQAVKDYLVARGVAGDRILEVNDGGALPACHAATEVCWQKNRRVDFIVKVRNTQTPSRP